MKPISARLASLPQLQLEERNHTPGASTLPMPSASPPAGATAASAPTRRTTVDWWRSREALAQGSSSVSEIGFDVARPAAHEARSAELERTAFCQQAAYILVRQFQGRPLSAAQKELMWRVSEVRTEVLKMLPLGRSNVVDDVAACDQQKGGVHSTYRALAARQLKWDIPNGTLKSHAYIPAALTAVAGSGSCGDHANLAMHLLGRVLKPGERLIKQKGEGLDHSWVRIEGAPPEGGPSDCGPAGILDAWADGPVIDPADCEFVRSQVVQNLVIFDSPSARTAYESFQREKTAKYEKPIADLACQLQKKGQAAGKTGDGSSRPDPLSDIVVWHPTSVLHRSFLRTLDRVEIESLRRNNTLRDDALEIAQGAPHWAQFQNTPNLARDIVAAALCLGTPEERSLLAGAPIRLGLVSA